MDITLLILVSLVFIAIIAVLWKGGWQLLLSGLKQAGHTLQSIWLRILLGFILGGMVITLIPSPLIAEWLGYTSGLKGIFIASCAGIIMPGGPYINVPIIASIYRAGAGVGPVIALLTSVSLLGLQALIVWYIPFLGAKIALTRYVVCLFIPPLVGLAGGAVYQLLTLV